MKDIKRVAVLGAGTMGGGIAGICANAGCEVLLLDVERGAGEAARRRLAAGRSPVLRDAESPERITCGSFADDLGKIADCDWICEAVVEDLSVKREMFSRVEAARADGALLSTNTSGIPLRDICAGLPERLQRDIAVTHFFNPAHLMKLVELVPGERTRRETLDALAGFLGNRLGKGVVHAKDTVNFIANRIGCFWMLAGLHLAEKAMREDGLNTETVDRLTSVPLGLPPGAGLYGLIDLIGLDVMFNVGANLDANLPANDAGRRFTAFTDRVQRLYERGQLGRKTGGGFYQLTRHDDGSRTLRVFDLHSEHWRTAEKPELPPDQQTLPGLFASDNANGRFARELVTETLCYAAGLVPEISDDIVNIDRAMRWGFNWQRGPFEMIDQIGAPRLIAEIKRASPEPPGMLRVLEGGAGRAFYRDAGGGREYLTAAGDWAAVQESV
ncbi:MAG: 3-hydroxyacyl-CoA dehydrogenase family protein [Gammaproteobacteria bacterium]|nr:3-hydroxyacyl-CoA dehydrogenase family protein [Gammaproteobacteria bacterium]